MNYVSSYLNAVKACFSLVLFVFFFATSPVVANEKDAATVIHEITQHMIMVIRNSKLDQTKHIAFCTECSHEFEPRHIYQRAIDIETYLDTFLIMYGEKIESDHDFSIKKITYKEIVDKLRLLDEKFEKILRIHDVTVSHDFLTNYEGKHTDFYSALDRLEKLLLSMGAPSVRPDLVIRRALSINQLAKSFCKSEVCSGAPQTDLKLITPKLPKDVFIELHQFVKTMNTFSKVLGIEISGGVVAPKPSTMGMITPRAVNRLSGVVLADLIALRDKNGNHAELVLPESLEGITPTDVWYQINDARLFLEDYLHSNF